MPEYDKILDYMVVDSDIGDVTIRDYLRTLLLTLWHEKEGFDGKRPFGNSGWDRELYRALVVNGAIRGEEDDGYLEWVDKEAAHELIENLIIHIFETRKHNEI
jgi:hypothetical protein